MDLERIKSSFVRIHGNAIASGDAWSSFWGVVLSMTHWYSIWALDPKIICMVMFLERKGHFFPSDKG
jgi:hypothetical protein